jgi:hypothetical protein
MYREGRSHYSIDRFCFERMGGRLLNQGWIVPFESKDVKARQIRTMRTAFILQMPCRGEDACCHSPLERRIVKVISLSPWGRVR